MNTKLITHKQSLKYIIAAFSLTAILMVGQFTAAYFANSLALFADGSHLLVHNSSLLIALISSIVSFNLAKKKSDKAEMIDIMGGMINGAIFLSIAIIICFKGFERLDIEGSGVAINPVIMAISSFIAFLIHCLSAYILSKGRKHSFNVHAIFLHTFFDCISTVLTFSASVVIFFTGFEKADSFVSFVIAVLVAFSGLRLLKKCIKKAFNIRKAKLLIRKIDIALEKEISHIIDIHEQDISFAKSGIYYSAHIVLDTGCCVSQEHDEQCLNKIKSILSKNFDINDTMIQLEYN